MTTQQPIRIMYVGIDASINSTGVVCISNDYIKMFQITSDNVKHSSSVVNISYERINTNTKNYSVDDLNKITNAQKLASVIKSVVLRCSEQCKPDEIHVRMEGSLMSFGFKSGASRLNDLVCNNTIIKLAILNSSNIKEFTILSPTELKKAFTGNGRAKKDQMIKMFLTYVPEYDMSIGKNDDIADAFALAKVKH